MNRKWPALIVITTVVMLSGTSCQSYRQQDEERLETPERGWINISADESFRPVIDEEIKVFEANNRFARVNVTYKPEADCLKDFWNDSIRMVITTRHYTNAEERMIIDSMHASPSWDVVANDAIAVIVNPSSPDSVFSMEELKSILAGTSDKKLVPVFDGAKATSTVRFIVDSILKDLPLNKNAMAAGKSQEVVDFVARTPGAIGFIGAGWIGNPEDPEQAGFLKKVRVAAIESRTEPGTYVLPVQANIYEKRYPMVRDLVYVLKEQVHLGLGYGFARFLRDRTGQLIFKRAYLAPAHENFILRTVQVKE